MSNISFFALGGLDEKDKKCFVLGVNNEYFIFNIGISIPIFSSLGMNKIVPDYKWIEKNKNKIKGIFISTAIFENVGGLLYLNSFINKIPIYTSNIGKIILENFFNKKSMKNTKNFEEYIINEVKPLHEIKVGNVSITPFLILNCSPNSLGFIFNTNDGAVIILDDFIISADESLNYKNQIYEINKITKNKNLLLISSVGNITKPYGFTSPNHNSIDFIESEINPKLNKRYFVCCFDYDLFNIIKIIKFSQKIQTNIIIHNSTLYNLILKFISLDFFENKNLLMKSISKINETERCIVLIAYNKNKLFNIVSGICMENDEFIKYRSNDKFILAFNTVNGYELQEANTIDFISSIDIEWSKLPKNILELKASTEDHKLLLDFLKPKYVIPTSGLYYEFIEYKNNLSEKINKNNLLILENGKQINLNNGIYENSKNNYLDIKERYIGNLNDNDEINHSLLNERKLMGENGVVFISILLKKNNDKFEIKELKNNYCGIYFDQKLFEEDLKNLNDNIIKLINDSYNNKNINSKELKNLIKKISTKFYEKLLGKNPLILTTIIDR